ncbi:MAG: hypothetical protein M1575_00635 [Patescibacteria group bacterium]|nr:hypothetical protein [Patescibacteria group bacterium]MCL5095233.1 hypothetical protein [Patescibacteria group bacterium]
MSKEELLPHQEISPQFLTAVFSSRVFSERVREVFAKTERSLVQSVRMAKEILPTSGIRVPEFGFNIDRSIDGKKFYILFVLQGQSGSMERSDTKISLTRYLLYQITLGKNPKFLAFVHFHDPWEDPIFPSVYAASDDKEGGDVYSLLRQRKVALSKTSTHFTRKTIIVTGRLQSPMITEYPVKFLFCQEGERVERMPEDELKEKLLELESFFIRNLESLSQEEVIACLRGLGYNIEFFAIPTKNFKQGSLFSQEDLRRMAIFSF